MPRNLGSTVPIVVSKRIGVVARQRTARPTVADNGEQASILRLQDQLPEVRWYAVLAIQNMGGRAGKAGGSLAVDTAGIAFDARSA